MSSDRFAIWVRCNDAAKLPVLLELEEALQEDGHPVWFEITLPAAAGNAMGHPIRSREVARFLGDLTPKILLWVGGQLDPTTISAALAKDVKIVVADAGIAMLPRMARGWFPGKTRALLSQLSHVFARTSESAEGLIRAGVRSDRITASGGLQTSVDVPSYDEDQRLQLANRLGPRPMWVAAHVDSSELEALAAAQKEATRRAHRLLCIALSADAPEITAAFFQEQGFIVSAEHLGESPEEATQIHVTDGLDEVGLWYRMAPVTVIGGSFGTGARIDPFQVATVGSVAVHGSSFGPYSTHFEQLTSANASVECTDLADLGSAISNMLSAEKVAQRAHNGWEVTSRGAEVMNLIRSHLGGILDA